VNNNRLQKAATNPDSYYFHPASPIIFSTEAETFLNALAKMVVLILDEIVEIE
jgi:hypothetical protein